MSGRIPEDIIDKIRDEVAIEDVVGHFVPLRRKGSSFWAPCPFHNEKTPSFHVHPQRQIFYCFGCHRGGNVFKFLMDKEGMSFPEAVQWCASRIGLDLERFLRDEDRGPDPRTPVLEANRWLADWLAKQLGSPAGANARDYLCQRGVQPEIIERFGLGFAPADGQRMIEAAKKAGIEQEILLRASLLRRREGAAPFAYFRSRLIFPIRGIAQKIYGFGGRILGPGEPKYLNSPETPVFQKRRTLYALAEARSELVRSSTGILVEGYLDAISLHQAGWTNAVATCGTAFTPEQARALRRYADHLILLFDGDAPGRKAAFKSADVALEAGLDVRIAKLPAQKDPADLVAAGEVATLRGAIDEAPGLVECMAQEVAVRGGSRPVKERALHHVASLLSRIPDPIRAELLMQEAAETFSVPAALLRPKATERPRRDSAESLEHEEGPRAQLERRILSLGLTSRAARQHLGRAVTADDFHFERLSRVFDALMAVEDDVDVADISKFRDLDAEFENLVAELLIQMPSADFDAASELGEVLSRLHQLDERQRARKQRERLDEAYRSGEDWQSALRQQSADGSSSGPTDPL